jgi:predicted Zn-ribbon and HTH transcriptional regulator
MGKSRQMAKVKVFRDGWKCERCGHDWIPKTAKKPTVCPACKSPYFDRPRQSKAEK